MRKDDRFRIISIIQKQLEAVEPEIRDLQELTKPVAPDNAIGRVSRMDAINNKAINDSALREKKKLKLKLEKALERSGDEAFGRCMTCGNDIAIGRLEYLPYTTRCVQCAG